MDVEKNMNKEQEMIKAVNAIYEQGYICGINDNKWFEAFAKALIMVANGKEFTDALVDDCFDEIAKTKAREK